MKQFTAPPMFTYIHESKNKVAAQCSCSPWYEKGGQKSPSMERILDEWIWALEEASLVVAFSNNYAREVVKFFTH